MEASATTAAGPQDPPVVAPEEQQQQQQQQQPASPSLHRTRIQTGSLQPKSVLPVVSSKRQKSATKKKSKKKNTTPKYLDDCIRVHIPVDVTADLRIVLEHVRAKRLKRLYQDFPQFRPVHDQQEAANKQGGEALEENAASSPSEDPMEQLQQQQQPKHVPQRHQFGSVLDYLEAKYVKGIVMDEEEPDALEASAPGATKNKKGKDEEEDDDDRSVYSQSSFLDDTDLQRQVAEHYMAQNTLTKLELQAADHEFFVNVGNLELDNDAEYDEQYDPVADAKAASKEEPAKKKKKRRKKKSLEESTKGVSPPKTPGSSPVKKRKLPTGASSEKKKKKSKSKASAAPGEENNGATTTSTTDASIAADPKVQQAKKTVDDLFQQLSQAIKKLTSDQMPRQKSKLKVALICPAGKNPGDEVRFSNPHWPGQRCSVKVPKDIFPGETFKATVAVKPPDEDDDEDHNKFPRSFQVLVDDCAYAFDEYCTIEAPFHQDDPKYSVYKAKQAKFGRLASLFPKDLKTKVDAGYMRKLVRRVRQNRKKRVLPDVGAAETTTTPAKQANEKTVVHFPSKGTSFPSVEFNEGDFEYFQTGDNEDEDEDESRPEQTDDTEVQFKTEDKGEVPVPSSESKDPGDVEKDGMQEPADGNEEDAEPNRMVHFPQKGVDFATMTVTADGKAT